jgi:hypothetical protein
MPRSAIRNVTCQRRDKHLLAEGHARIGRMFIARCYQTLSVPIDLRDGCYHVTCFLCGLRYTTIELCFLCVVRAERI